MWVSFKEKTSYGTSNINSGSLGGLHTSLHLFARTREIGRYNHHRSSSFPGAQWKDLHAYYFVWIAVSHLPKHVVIIHSNYCDRGLAAIFKENTRWCTEAKIYREGKNLGSAASSAELVLPSNSPIHLNISSTSTEDKAHLLQISHFLLLFLEFSQPFFVNAFRPLSAEPWVRKVQDCRGLGSLNRHSSRRYIHTHLSCARLGPKTVAHCPDPSPIHLPCLAS